MKHCAAASSSPLRLICAYVVLRIRLKRGLKHSFSGKKNAITSGGGGGRKKDLTASKKEQGKGVIPLKFPPCASDNILLAESAIQYSCSLCLRSTTKPFRYNRKYRLVLCPH